MSKAAELASLIGNINAGGGGVNRNVIINGNMSVAQRGTSSSTFTADTGDYRVCDRWAVLKSGTDGAFTVSQDSSAPEGFANSLKFDCTTADTSIASGEILQLIQSIEGQNLQHFKKGTSSANPWALSFYVKGNGSATYVAELLDADNSRHVAKSFSVTSDWTRVEMSLPSDTTGTLDDDNNASLQFSIWLHAGSTFTSGTLQTSWGSFDNSKRVGSGTTSFFDSTARTFFITGVQLEVGQNPTEFEHEPFERTLKKCERYFTRINAKGSVQAYNCFPFNGFCRSSTLAQIVIHWNQPMRSVPAMSYAGASDFGVLDSSGSTVAVSAINTSRTTENASVADWTSSSLSAGNGTRLLANNTADPFIDADAEL